MVQFLDGPAQGVRLMLARAPIYLRVVRNHVGEWNALDQPDDTPEAGEAIFAYRRVGEAGSLHLDRRNKRGRRVGEWYQTGEYRVLEQPDDATLRDTEAWRAWALAQHQQTEE